MTWRGSPRWRHAARGPVAAGLCLTGWLAVAGGPDALAHELQHEVTAGPAVVIQLHYADGAPFSYEAFELYRADEPVPYQVGRSDATGRVCFVPDREGEWRLRSFSEDGHGLDVTFHAGPAGAIEDRPAGFLDRYPRIATGVGFVLGLFGIVSLWTKRRKG